MLKKYSLAFKREGSPTIHYGYVARDGELEQGWCRDDSSLFLFNSYEEVSSVMNGKIENYRKNHGPVIDKMKVGQVKRSDNVSVYDIESLAAAFIMATPAGEIITTNGVFVVSEVEIKPVLEMAFTV